MKQSDHIGSAVAFSQSFQQKTAKIGNVVVVAPDMSYGGVLEDAKKIV